MATSIQLIMDGKDRASGAIRRVLGGLKSFTGLAGGALGVATGLAAGVARATTQYLKSADALSKLSERTGLATDELGALQYAFAQNDLSASDLERTLARLNDQGLTVDQVADEIASLEDVSQQTARAVDIFGERLGPRLLTVLNDGQAGLRRYREEAQRLGLTIDQESADAAAKFNDNLDTIGRAFGALGTRIGEAVTNKIAPAVQTIGEKLGVLPSVAQRELKALEDEIVSRYGISGEKARKYGQAVKDGIVSEMELLVALASGELDKLDGRIEQSRRAYNQWLIQVTGQGVAEQNVESANNRFAEFIARQTGLSTDYLAGILNYGGPEAQSLQRDFGDIFREHQSILAANTGAGAPQGGLDNFQLAELLASERRRRREQEAMSAFYSDEARISGLFNRGSGLLPGQPDDRSPLGGGNFYPAAGFPWLNPDFVARDRQLAGLAPAASDARAPGGGGYGGFGGMSISPKEFGDYFKGDPLRVAIAGIGGANEDAAKSDRIRYVNVSGDDGDSLINLDALIDLMNAVQESREVQG